jgi:hypothetical protein
MSDRRYPFIMTGPVPAPSRELAFCLQAGWRDVSPLAASDGVYGEAFPDTLLGPGGERRQFTDN